MSETEPKDFDGFEAIDAEAFASPEEIKQFWLSGKLPRGCKERHVRHLTVDPADGKLPS